MVFQGKFHNPVFIEFMKRLLRQAKGKLYLIVDGHPVHRSAIAGRFVADNLHRLRLIRLPGYCPELNPDELLNQDVKTNALGKSRPTTKVEPHGGTIAASPATGCGLSCPRSCGGEEGLRNSAIGVLLSARVGFDNPQSFRQERSHANSESPIPRQRFSSIPRVHRT